MANKTIVSSTLDDVFQSLPIGSIEQAIGNNLYGINHRQIPGMVPSNRDTVGFTFFVRPQLNLQGNNIRNIRAFYPLLNQERISIPTAIRCLLDPRLQYGYKGTKVFSPPIQCPLVDPLNAFIPILTNNAITSTGWPDLVVPTFTSKEGLYGESYSQVDGTTNNYSTNDLDVTFRNTRGDPIVYLFYIWERYSSLVFEGKLLPYPDFIIENTIDYNTRIYRVTLDITKQEVRKIVATGVAFPVSNPLGQFFDYNVDRPYIEQTKEITIRLRCSGFEPFDPILVQEFNETVCIFNPSMRDGVRSDRRRSSSGWVETPKAMVKLDQAAAGIFNHRGYPRINPDDYRLEWWVSKEFYAQRTGVFLKQNLNTSPAAIKDYEETGD